MSETHPSSDHLTRMLASVEAGIRALQDRLAAGAGTPPPPPATAAAVDAGLSALQSRLAEVETRLLRPITRLEAHSPTAAEALQSGLQAVQSRLTEIEANLLPPITRLEAQPPAAAEALQSGLQAVQSRLAEIEANLLPPIARLEARPSAAAETFGAGLHAVQSRLAEIETNLVRRITRLEAQLNQMRNAHTLYLGDHEALTRLYTGHRIYVDTRDVGICSHLMLEGRWEPWIEKIIAEAVKPGMTFLDVGANFGYYTLLSAAWVGAAGKVYSFEANPQIFRHLRKSVSINGFDGWVTLHNLAVHAEEATLRFSYTDEYSGGGSTMGGPQGSHQVEVRAAPLDALLADVPAVNVMKVDVEGAEPYVFQGARALMDRSPDLTLIVEFHEGSTRPILPPLQYLQNFITQGFALALIEPTGLTGTMTAEQCLQRLQGQLGYLHLTRGAA